MSPVVRELKNAALILTGILSAGLGIHGFLLHSGLIDGGVTGISMLLSRVTRWPLAVLLPLVNLPFIIIGYRQLGLAFSVRGALAIGGLALALAFIHFPWSPMTWSSTRYSADLFLGAGIGLAVRGGAVLDGTEIAALLISRHSTLVKVGDVILIFNVVYSYSRWRSSVSSRRCIRSSRICQRPGRWTSSFTASKSTRLLRSCRTTMNSSAGGSPANSDAA